MPAIFFTSPSSHHLVCFLAGFISDTKSMRKCLNVEHARLTCCLLEKKDSYNVLLQKLKKKKSMQRCFCRLLLNIYIFFIKNTIDFVMYMNSKLVSAFI